MYKVKMFSTTLLWNLEKDINAFLESNPNIVPVNISVANNIAFLLYKKNS